MQEDFTISEKILEKIAYDWDLNDFEIKSQSWLNQFLENIPDALETQKIVSKIKDLLKPKDFLLPEITDIVKEKILMFLVKIVNYLKLKN